MEDKVEINSLEIIRELSRTLRHLSNWNARILKLELGANQDFLEEFQRDLKQECLDSGLSLVNDKSPFYVKSLENDLTFGWDFQSINFPNGGSIKLVYDKSLEKNETTGIKTS